jgi:hypothetical protein
VIHQGQKFGEENVAENVLESRLAFKLDIPYVSHPQVQFASKYLVSGKLPCAKLYHYILKAD